MADAATMPAPTPTSDESKEKKTKRLTSKDKGGNGSIFDCCIARRGGRRALSRVLMMTLEGVEYEYKIGGARWLPWML
jgi:hypothetical protein